LVSSELFDQMQRALGDAYTLEGELTGGGMSRVFVARDNALGRKVVIKVMPRELAASVSVDRFRREIGLAVALQHPHIVGVLSAGEADGLPYFIMPFVEGESLRTRIERGRLSVVETVRVLRDVARALAYAHERGIVHRDIKPDNVLISAGSAAVADFGVAKALAGAISERLGSVSGAHRGANASHLTAHGTSLGTPAYMAPEQAAADPATDHRADIYAFGVMAYEMLAGAPPFSGTTPQALLAAQLTERPRPLAVHRADVPAALQALVMRCLEKEPANRPQSAGELVAALEDPAVVSGAFASMPSGDAMRAAVPGRSFAWPIAIAAVAVAVALGTMVTMRSRPSAPAASPASAAPAPAAPRSIAVLPLVNIGRDSTDDYFADGMTEELTSKLSRVRGLRVASRTAATSVRDRNASPSDIAKALNVATLLEGTVQRDGRRIRLTARLVNAGDGFTLWSDVFESEEKDLFSVQDQISQAIVAALGSELGDSSGRNVTAATPARGTVSLEAYNDYLRGRFFFEKRNLASLRKALDYYQKSIAADPGYALAYAAIADVYAALPQSGEVRGEDTWKKGIGAADKAISLDTALAEGYAARGNILNGSWKWADARRDLEHAIALRPSYGTAHQWYGENLLLNGRVSEAVRELAQATELDPVSPIVNGSYALALGIAGRAPDAIARGRQAVDLDPTLYTTRFMLGTTMLYAGRTAEATRELAAALSMAAGAEPVKGMLGYAYAKGGDVAKATAFMQELERASSRDNASAAVARIALGLGDTTKALVWLEKAAQRHDTFFSTESMASRIFDPVRANPRFAAVLRLANLDAAALTRLRSPTG
jgi:TolB-like protein/Flp pilus assembly protein TadD